MRFFHQGKEIGRSRTESERTPSAPANRFEGAISRELTEGGYTFLKRALAKALSTGQPVVINSGRNYLQYTYRTGQKNFMEGITVLEGDDKPALEAFRGVAEKYIVSQGVQEIQGS